MTKKDMWVTIIFSIERLVGLSFNHIGIDIKKSGDCQCGSSLKGVMLGAQAIQCGDADVVVAGGMENMRSAPYYMKKVRWGSGLEVVMSDISEELTAKGLVLAIEPKTIFPGKCVVGIQDTHLVTEDGLESLTNPGKREIRRDKCLEGSFLLTNLATSISCFS